MTSIGLLYNSQLMKRAWQLIDERKKTRQIYKMRDIFCVSGRVMLWTITIITFYMLVRDDMPYQNSTTYKYAQRAIESIVVGLSSVSIFFCFAFLETILIGMVEEARQ